MRTRQLSRSQIVLTILSLLVVLSMVISAFASLFTNTTPDPQPTRTPVVAPR